MTTKPVARQERGPVSTLDKAVNEPWVQGEEGASLNHGSPLQHKKAPKAEPEEDIDFLEPETEIKTPQERIIEMENQESTCVSMCTPRKTQEQVSRKLSALQSEKRPEELADLCEDAFPPSPSLCALSTAEYYEKNSLCLEGEVTEWISDVVVTDPAGDLTSPDSQDSQESPETLNFVESIDQQVDSSTSEEMTGGDVSAEEHVTTENMSHPSHYSLSDNSDDANSVSSPPFVDESEEDETVSNETMPCQQQWNTNKAFLPPHAASPAPKQQGGMLPQRQSEPEPRGVNQEAPQQVFGQRSPPLSNVAMELSNQGAAASQDCVVAVRERHSRAGESTERQNEQTGGEERQKHRGLQINRPAGQQHQGGLLRTVQTQEHKTGKYSSGVSLKHSRHHRMENDSCDDSQSDSGLSADFSPCSTFESTTAISTVKETPIEREIRRAMEREHSLRRSRGLPNLPTAPEYVEVPLRKTVLCQSLPAKSEKYQVKDREFAGKKMQHEIHEETQREQDLVKLGKVLGFYDKGTVRQIKERKQLFEAFQTPSDVTIPSRSKTASWSSAGDGLTLENQEDMPSDESTIEGSCMDRRCNVDLLSPTQGPNAAKGQGSGKSSPREPRFSEGSSGQQVVILENNLRVPAQRHYHVKPEPETVVDSRNTSMPSSNIEGRIAHREQELDEKEEEVAPKENPFFKLRPSTNLVKVKQDILEAQEREKQLRQQRLSLYGGRGGAEGEGRGGQRPVSMEGMTPTLSSSENGLAVPDTPMPSSKGRPSAGWCRCVCVCVDALCLCVR